METVKRYLMFQAMMFVFGIVGPIFLIMYFASQPDHTVRWAYWAGLFVTAGFVASDLGSSTDSSRFSGDSGSSASDSGSSSPD